MLVPDDHAPPPREARRYFETISKSLCGVRDELEDESLDLMQCGGVRFRDSLPPLWFMEAKYFTLCFGVSACELLSLINEATQYTSDVGSRRPHTRFITQAFVSKLSITCQPFKRWNLFSLPRRVYAHWKFSGGGERASARSSRWKILLIRHMPALQATFLLRWHTDRVTAAEHHFQCQELTPKRKKNIHKQELIILSPQN